jgi:hypothetical protein
MMFRSRRWTGLAVLVVSRVAVGVDATPASPPTALTPSTGASENHQRPMCSKNRIARESSV